MKSDIHPDYHPVVFQDATTGALFLTRSTITSLRTDRVANPDRCAQLSLSGDRSVF